ncbi:MAG: hypothetical protein V4516_06650 [Pseudomonadota bacterium]
MKAGLALIGRLGFFSQKSTTDNTEDDRYDMRLKRLVRPTDNAAAPKGLVFKTAR